MKTAPTFFADSCWPVSVQSEISRAAGLCPLAYLNLEEELFRPTDGTSSALHSFHDDSSKAWRFLDDRPGRLDIVVLAYHPVLSIDCVLRHLTVPKAEDRTVVRSTEDSDLVLASEDPRGVERVHVALGARVGEPHPLQVEPLAYESCIFVLLARRGSQVQANIVESRYDGLANDPMGVAVYASTQLSDQVKIPESCQIIVPKIERQYSVSLVPVFIPDKWPLAAFHR